MHSSLRRIEATPFDAHHTTARPEFVERATTRIPGHSVARKGTKDTYDAMARQVKMVR